VFETALRLLHPFMPFLTEELWHQLPQLSGAQSIALGAYPEPRPMWKNAAVSEQFAFLQQVIGEFRDIRAQMKLDPKKKVAAEFASTEQPLRTLIEGNKDATQRLAILSELSIGSAPLSRDGGGLRSKANFEARIVHAESVDPLAEMARVKKEIEKLTVSIASKEKQLGNETFRGRAPENIIQGMQATLGEQRAALQKLQERLDQLEGQR